MPQESSIIPLKALTFPRPKTKQKKLTSASQEIFNSYVSFATDQLRPYVPHLLPKSLLSRRQDLDVWAPCYFPKKVPLIRGPSHTYLSGQCSCHDGN